MTAVPVASLHDVRHHYGSVAALEDLRKHSAKAGELLDQAAGVLVFPDVVKMGFGVGGEFGEGVLIDLAPLT